MSKLSVLVSTADDGIYNMENIIQEKNKGVKYIICHQLINKLDNYEFDMTGREDVIYKKYRERGLSKSRNRAIDLCQSEIAIIADDDVNYFKDSFNNIINAFEKYKEADVITFQIDSTEWGSEFKHYDSEPKWLKLKNSPKVSSIEIGFRVKSIKDHDIKFNERFGLGSELIGGEETLFIRECINKGLNVLYLPYKIVKHPYESSGKSKDMVYSESGIKTRGANNYIHFNNIYILMNFIFIIRHYNKYKNKMGIKKCYDLIFKGSRIAKYETGVKYHE